MTSVLFSNEELLFFQDFMNEYLSTVFTTYQNRPLMAFAERNMQIKPAMSDEQRITQTNLEQDSGTVGLVDANGIPTGLYYNSGISVTPSSISRKEYGAVASFAHRNRGKLNEMIRNVMNLEHNDDTLGTSMKAFAQSQYGEKLRKKMENDLLYHLESAIGTLFDNATTATVFGDTVIANSGTTFNFDNLVSGAVSSATLKTVINLFKKHTNERGIPMNFTTPQWFFCASDYYADWEELLNLKYGSNVNYRNILDIWDDSKKTVDTFPTSSSYSMLFTDASGFAMEADSAMPVARVGQDEYGNLKIVMSWIWGIGWKSRTGIIRISH